MNTIFLAGYSGHTVEELRDAAQAIDALVVDIRLSPRSKMPQWGYNYLTQTLPMRYLHCAHLGNVNYKRGEIKIADMNKGLDFVEHLAAIRPLILLCGCKALEGCHRQVVGESLELLGYDVKEMEWPSKAEKEPQGVDVASARGLAMRLRDEMKPFCERIEIAGSIRRDKPFVKDIEIVCVPKWEKAPNPDDMFGGEVLTNRLYQWAQTTTLQWIKPGAKEIELWHVKSEGKYWRGFMPMAQIKVDIFLVTPKTWGMQFLIRTGSGDFSKAVVTHALKIGLPCDNGALHRGGVPISTPEEKDVFTTLGLRYIEPEDRTDALKVVSE